ncbi:MAG: hypothetical protein ABSB35_32710 [Bryobacteraceae bacterium]
MHRYSFLPSLLSCIVAWEQVYTVNNFWDRLRRDVADVSGQPHIYESRFNEARDDFEDFYFVSPIEPELLALVLEDWDIWTRWSEAFDRGETQKENHPAPPQDRLRHDELKQLIGQRFKSDAANCRKRRGEFRNVRPGWNGLEVQWSEPEPSLRSGATMC